MIRPPHVFKVCRPGPDGITAGLVQQQWGIFGPIIIDEVQKFFSTGIMKPHIAHSNLVLIPKSEAPLKVTDFRPISVCNLIYKVISKLLAKRMQPFMSSIISTSQTAFIPGREISENVLLLREVIHSFKRPTTRDQQFVFKADLAKAFDRLSWNYLFQLLPEYGFSRKFCNWVEACVKSAKFTILFNGSGDGFFLPQRGLRQGCAMSPYLFIIAMDPLARLLEARRRSAQIRGLKIARSANPILCSLFADDLLLMGRLCDDEINQFQRAINLFSTASGLTINPAKSKVWFCSNSTPDNKTNFMRIMQVDEAGHEEKYLGCPVRVDGTNCFDYLIDKFERRLNHWKANFLSHAGRLVLIKSVLDSMPIYAMGTILLPKKVVKKLTAISRNFFWGGSHDKRSMAYVAWGKITQPKGMGGLGLRSIEEMNKALVLKVIWKLASNADAQWVQLLQAKYYPRGAFWSTQRNTRCSKLWRNLMHLRPFLQHHICWKIGSGFDIPLYSQPWFPGWTEFTATTTQQRQARVSSLLNPITRTWDFEALQQLMGFTRALAIATLDSIRPAPSPAPDTLIFAYAKDGKFTVKKAYQLLKGDNGLQSDKAFWDWLWGKVPLIPKLKVFLWRAVHGALPVKAVLAARINHIDPICQLCRREPETVMHCLFLCDFARGAWLASNLGLRSDTLQGDFKEIIRGMALQLHENDLCSFVCMLWAIWRSRNEAVYREEIQSLPSCLAMHKATLASCQTRQLVASRGALQNHNRAPIINAHSNIFHETHLHSCYVDGSWDEQGKAGVGVCIMIHGEVVFWMSKAIQALSPAQAEARAVLEGLKAMGDMALEEGRLFTDSLETVSALIQHWPVISDWRSHGEIWQIWSLQHRLQHRVDIKCCAREYHHLVTAHRLANQARMYDWDRLGHSMPVFDIAELS